MNKVVGQAVVSMTELELFDRQVASWINQMQHCGQEVEVQFSTNVIGQQVVYNALILGRKIV